MCARVCVYTHTHTHIYIYIIIYTGCFTTCGHSAGGDFLGLCDQKNSYKYMSDFGWLQSYDCLKLRIESNDYWQQMEKNNKPA